MQMEIESDWLEKFSNWFKGTALVAVMLLSGTALEANVGFTLEGCRASDTMNYHQVTLQAGDGSMVPTYICDDSAYTTGNLKGWAELDYVPHRVTVENKSSVPETFTFTVGGDFLQTEGGDLRGWDDITKLVLDPQLSDQACFDIQSQSTQALLITPDNEGAGGVFTTIYRKVDVVGLPAGAKCVAHYNARLAIGSHLYPGSSLQSNLWNENLDSGGIGEKRVQLPDVLAQDFSKTMVATQDSNHIWSIAKSTENTTVNFGDTCAVNAVLEKPVSITVQWVKGPASADGNVNVKTVISAVNPAKRDLTANVVDTLYSGTTALDSKQCSELLTAGHNGPICTHDFVVTEAQAVELNDKAVLTYVDPDYPTAVITITQEAMASAAVQPSGVDNNKDANITDHEWIFSANADVSYSADSFTPDIGTFDNGYTGATTQGDVNWTSALQSDSGTVTFSKTVYIPGPTITTGTLSDKAYLNASGGFTTDSGNPTVINVVADATVTLTITKTVPDILQGAETVDFNFTVATQGYSQDFFMTFNAGETQKDLVVSGLEPGVYTVTENPTAGFAPIGDVTKQVDMTLPTCAAPVVFNNELAGQPKVVVRKVTLPETIGGTRQDGDWNMTLYKQNDASWDVVMSLLTTAGDGTDEMVAEGQLAEGTYKIEETMKNGWYESGKAGSCEFTVNYPADLFRADYECTYTNTKYAKIIVDKITDPTGSNVAFGYTQDINGTSFVLKDGWAQMYNDLTPGTYTVTENDPTPGFDLVDLQCVETNSDTNPNTQTSLNNRQAIINLDPGETVSCTYTNRERGMVEVTKVENGTAPTHDWTFTLNGPDVSTSGTIPPNPLNFNGAKLIPGATYTLCETGVPVAWETTWTLNGVPVASYNPNAGTPEATNEDRCVDFSVTAGQTVAVVVDNTPPPTPGGEPRTIGYWKNWSTCSGGNQAEKAAEKGGAAEGFFLIDDVLPMLLGSLNVTTCEDAVAILNKSDVTPRNKKRASDAAYGMAAQLTAAKANYAAGAQQCSATTDAITAADALLTEIGFDATKEYLTPKKSRKEPQKT